MDLSFCLCSVCCYSILLLLLFLILVKGISSFFAFGSSKRKFCYHHLPGDMNNNIIIMQNLTERLRPLVGLNGWDYCVYWKLTEDQRYVEWLGCCCGGTENNENGGEEDHHLFPVASCCRDTMFPHPRTKPCDLLSHLPNSIPIDSGIHAQTLLTNQPNWVNYSNTLEETIGTQVLIPVPGGLVELFVTNKQVAEDHQVIDFVTTQCIALMEQEAGGNHSVGFTNNNIDVNSISNHNTMQQSNPLLGDENEGNNNNNNNDIDMPISLCSSPLNFMHQFSYNNTNNTLKPTTELEEQQQCMMMSHDTVQDMHDAQYVDPMMDTKEHDEQKQSGHVAAGGRSDSVSDCSDQNEEAEEEERGGGRRRSGKGNQSKNLVAERKRRKKLNDRLYNLRSLVPRISKLDRASILGDAIEFVKDLQKQVKELQDELEENSDTAAAADSNNNQFVSVNDINNGGEGGKAQYGFHVGNGYVPKQKQELDAATTIDNKQTQQMEPQVEVALIDGNEYFVKVFCEHRPGGFVRLMEALNTLGMDVMHATVTSHKGLVSNVFKVEKKDSEMVEAEDVRESLLELTRNNPSSSCRGWTTNEMTSATISSSENNNGAVGRDHHQHHLHNHQMEMAAYHPHPFHTT